MLRVHVPLTLACLLTTPLLWVGGVWFSRVVRPGYARNRELVDALTGTLSESVAGRAGHQGLRAAGGSDPSLRRRQRPRARPATLDLLAAVRVRFLARLPEPGQPDRAARLRRHAGRPRETAAGRGLDRVRRAARAIFQSGLQGGGHRQQRAAKPHGARRVFEVLDTPIEITSPPPTRAVRLPRPGRVRFEQVEFDRRVGRRVRGAGGRGENGEEEAAPRGVSTM